MYNYYYCKKLKDNLYENKIDSGNLDFLIDKYKLINKGIFKEYWINNVLITSNKKTITFKKIIDEEIKYENNYLIQKYEEKECIPFNFNESHSEDEHILYTNILNNIKIQLKKYDNYITIQYISENIINIDNFLYYIII